MPCVDGDEQAIAHVGEKLHLHEVNFFDVDLRDFRPRLVGVGIVIKILVAKHERNCEQAELTPGFTLDAWIRKLETENVKHSKDDHIGGNLRGVQDILGPLDEFLLGKAVW